MNEDRKRILNMVAEGKITVAEAEKLLDALARSGGGQEQAQSISASPAGATRASPRFLRVLVEDADEDGRPERVNIRVPINLLRAGMKLKTLIPESARAKIGDAFEKKGIHVDLNSLKASDVQELIEQLAELSVEVDGGKEKVRIFCE